ncbi:MAG: adenylosuccinate synthase [candidate division WOR-3 bacterium]|nr:adenylosuccinate synthase [candidate division WOR-3 bacterium]MCX7757219.1 adenylosuccinate synthase [candidate division WOR-3 bacterium]MDW7987945.1 adenylosuccinate synthase [candidate division WOR-3 bacterium]
MPSLAVIGLQWGDEGKGKIIDYLAQGFDLVARYQGGPNAGHTVQYKDLRFIFHQVPSGIINPQTLCVIGAGCVIDLATLKTELSQLKDAKVDYQGRLYIDSKAHLILPYHKAIDEAREAFRTGEKIGTTLKGIGPCYEDKYARIGIRFGDLRNEELFSSKLKKNLAQKNFLLMELYNQEPLSEKKIIDEYLGYAQEFKSYMADVSELVNTAYEQGKKILFEGAQGTLLDIDFGTYPYVTASSPHAGGICTGLGIGPKRIDEILGVAKAYTTRVGNGPFPTELFDETGRILQAEGAEFGATTGRARRCGWLDAVLLRYAVKVNNVKKIIITKLDVLDRLAELKICEAYLTKKAGVVKKISIDLLSDAEVTDLEPVYLKLQGWQKTTQGARKFSELPYEARVYLETIEKLVDCEIVAVSVGKERNDIILKNSFNW